MIALLVGCIPGGIPEVRDGPPTVEVGAATRFDVDAVLPTDLLPLPGDELLVLDGYRQRAVVYDGAGAVVRVIEGGPAWGQPVRIAAREGGYWLTDPVEGVVVAVDGEGAAESAFVVRLGDEEVHPVAVVDGLVVGDQHGRVLRVDPADGTATLVASADVDGEPFGAVVDLAVRGDGLLVVDALGHRVHDLGPDGTPRMAWGRFGMWPGTLSRVTSVAPTSSGHVVVTDSMLSAVQVFSAAGPVLGLIATEDGPLRPEHPVAVRADDDDPERFYVLDAFGPTVWTFRLASGTEEAASALADVRFLRVPLAEDVGAPGPALCVQCHDGLVRDARSHFDESRTHHPVDFAPDRTLPEDFPLTDGQMVCTTCHTPHGTPEGSTFLRASAKDSALCAACHGEAAHERVIEALGIPGDAHPVGPALSAALAGGLDVSGNCLECHAAHGGEGEPLLRTDGGCAGCHADHAVAGQNHPTGRRAGKDVPKPREQAALVMARDGGVQCRTCHDLVGGQTEALLRVPRDGGVLCLGCHAERDGFAHSDHAAAGCVGCHDPHGAPESAHFLHGTGADPQGCRTCHESAPGFDPGRLGHPIAAGTGAREVHGCLTCHDPHAASVPDAARCAECHSDQAAARDRGGHGGAVCTDCHDAHDAPRMAAGAPPRVARCLACHGAGGAAVQVFAFEHGALASRPDGSRWEPLDTLPLSDGRIACGTCHETHGPGAEGRGELRRDGWQDFCSACHGPDALTLYKTWHTPEKR